MTRLDAGMVALFCLLPMLMCLAWHPLAWMTVPAR